MFPPSILAHVFNGIVLLIAIILFFRYYTKMDNNKIVCATLLLSIAIGIHGLSHLGLEMHYGYNPLHLFSFQTPE
jgi:hypothetical protein